MYLWPGGLFCGALVDCYAWLPGSDATYCLLYGLNPAVVGLL